jgi:hypothetical protein
MFCFNFKWFTCSCIGPLLSEAAGDRPGFWQILRIELFEPPQGEAPQPSRVTDLA